MGGRRRDGLVDSDQQMQTVIYRLDKQQDSEPSVAQKVKSLPAMQETWV